MNFHGHIMYKINNNWVFDMTDFVGYRVLKSDGSKYQRGFKIADDANLTTTSYIETPTEVLRKTKRIIKDSREELAKLTNAEVANGKCANSFR